ncbi:MAG: hypothetical protein JWO19_6129 [Bryobacterales bacterium]|nr:hypothetical protein [Bryobacterales bacterium]
MNKPSSDFHPHSPTAYRLGLKAAGFSPIPANGKKPFLKGWQKCLDVPESEIELWAEERREETNTGIVTRRTPAFDIDILKAEAVEAVVNLVKERFRDRGRILQRTGKAPKVLIPFRTAEPFKKITINFAGEQKFELLCDGQQFISGGIHPDTKQPYTWTGGEPGEVTRQELPEITQVEAETLVKDATNLLVGEFGYTKDDAAPKAKAGDGLEQPQGGDLYLLRDAMGLIPNDDAGWDEWNTIAMALHAATGGSQDGLKLFMEWSAKSKKNKPAETEAKWRALDNCPPERVGAGTIYFKAKAATVAKINKTHAFVLAGNKGVVMRFDSEVEFRLLLVSAFKQWYSNQHVIIRDGDKYKRAAIGDWWLKHDERRQYQDIEFAPVGGRKGYYNMWQGFAAEPRKGDCSKFLAHLRDNVAQGNDDLYNWVVGWFAQIFQQPAVKIGTSLALRGPQGVGKTIVGKTIGQAVGSHYHIVSSSRYITGQFNAHMASLLLLHADEAFWAGDKKSEGILRDLVTGEKHPIEFKHIDPIYVANYVRLLVTGNQNWLVPAGYDERRFATLDVGEKHKQDHPYFAAIEHEMANGGLEALVHYLMNFDLRSVNLRVIPNTPALFDQKVESFDDKHTWWFDTLRRGQLPRMLVKKDETKIPHCPSSCLYDSYVRRTEQVGVKRKAVETALGIFLSKMVGPDLINARGIYHFPHLKECRRKFADLMNFEIEWSEPDSDWDEEPM